MFANLKLKLTENFKVDQRNSKSDYIRFSPAETTRIITTNSRKYLTLPRESSVISLLSWFKLWFSQSW